MLTKTLHALRRTQPLRCTTLAYAADEVDTLLAAPTDNPPPDARGTRVLSPALLEQILARGAAAQPSGGREGHAAGSIA